jgi:hypothetical protein
MNGLTLLSYALIFGAGVAVVQIVRSLIGR